MENIKQPTCGRVVHYFPNETEIVFNGQAKVPAMVQDDDTYPTLSIFTGNSDEPVVVVKTVPHESVKIKGRGYWAWPEIK